MKGYRGIIAVPWPSDEGLCEGGVALDSRHGDERRVPAERESSAEHRTRREELKECVVEATKSP